MLALLKSAKGKLWSKKKSQTHKRLIPDSCWSVGVEQGGGDGLQTMELTSSSNSSLRDTEEMTVNISVNISLYATILINQILILETKLTFCNMQVLPAAQTLRP